MDFVEFTFWLSREMKKKEIPGNAVVKFIDLNFIGIDTDEIVIDYDKQQNTVEIRHGENQQ